MSNINDVVEQYLTLPSSNALLITGEWGIGKTFFLKEKLFKKIKQIDTLKDSSKKYLPIYLSLFGINSIQDLERKIYLEIYSFLKTNTAKDTRGIIKAFSRAVFEMAKIGDIDKYLDDLGYNDFPIKQYDDVVICIDDFERKGDALSIKELVGYLNYLTNDFSFKVIIIADDKKLINNEKDDYSSLKEKVIGLQVEYLMFFKETFNSILSSQFSSDKDYTKFLNSNIDVINKFTGIANNNLRILIYFLTYFKVVYYNIIKFIEDNKNDKPIVCEFLQNQLTYLLKFGFAITIEFKNGNITFKQKNGLDYYYLNTALGKKEEETYSGNFKTKYFGKEVYTFYLSIYSHLTGGYKFNFIEFLKDFCEKNDIENGIVSPQYKLIHELSYPSVYDLSNDDYKIKTEQLYSYAKDGVYKIGDYELIFQFLVRFENINQEKIKSMVQDLIIGMDKSFSGNSTNGKIYQHIGEPDEFKDEHKEIRQHYFFLRNKMVNNEEDKQIQLLKKTLFKTPYDLLRIFEVDKVLSKYNTQPFLDRISKEEFVKHFLKFSNSSLNSFSDFLALRYSEIGYHSFFEKEFFNNLKIRIEEHLNTIPEPSLSKALFNQILQQITILLGE